MKIFVINLEKDKNRMENISSQLINFNLTDFERIDAIYGKDVYKNYDTDLNHPQLGIYLSFLKTCKQIVDQNLDYALVLEDDITLTEWCKDLENFINHYIPIDFDVCWFGNSRAKWPRNACNLIPSYDYDKIQKLKINDFIYKINHKNGNYPMGAYGLLVSRKAALKILDYKNHFKTPIDVWLVTNEKLEKYMSVPSLIVHCYDFDSNLTGLGNEQKINPFSNIWLKNPEKELEILSILESLTMLFNKNNINYSIAYGTMIGFGRNKKMIGYDDDIDIIINKKDLPKVENLMSELEKFSNVYKYKKPIINESLYYKIFNKNNYKKIEGFEYAWPFIDIFVYENREDKLFFNEQWDDYDIEEVFIEDYLESHNTGQKFKINVFRDYEKLLDILYGDWRCKCVSSSWNHTDEKYIKEMTKFNCNSIIPNYKNNICKNKLYYDKDNYYVKFLFLVLILFLIIVSLFFFFKKKK